jgi:hypothetical protein
MAVFWVVAPCSLVEVYLRFRGACCLHLQGDYRTHYKYLYSNIASPRKCIVLQCTQLTNQYFWFKTNAFVIALKF